MEYRKSNGRNVKRTYLKMLYGITIEDFERIQEDQDGKCKICGEEEKAVIRGVPLDHCHETGKIRGLLCHRCNKGLGEFGESPEMLRKAAEYLERSL